MNEFPKLPHHADYEVGYKKPPQTSQFRKGQSGNPKGRPKGARNRPSANLQKINDILLKEMASEIPITENGKTIRVSKVEAFYRSLSLQAIRGKTVGAMNLFAKLAMNAEREQRSEKASELQLVYNYKMAEEARVRRSIEFGQDYNPLPHPDHIEINAQLEEFVIRGPAEEWQLEHWEEIWTLKAELGSKLNVFERQIAERGNAASEELKHKHDMVQKHLDQIDMMLILSWKVLPKTLSDSSERREQLAYMLEHYFLVERNEEIPWWIAYYV